MEGTGGEDTMQESAGYVAMVWKGKTGKADGRRIAALFS